MPVYEYVCDECDHVEEIRQKITEAPITECPLCHKQTFRRIISNTTFVLQGTGWERDGYKYKNAKE